MRTDYSNIRAVYGNPPLCALQKSTTSASEPAIWHDIYRYLSLMAMYLKPYNSNR